jgi:histone H3/H4
MEPTLMMLGEAAGRAAAQAARRAIAVQDVELEVSA